MTNITEQILEKEWLWIFAFAAMIYAVYPIAKDIVSNGIEALSAIAVTFLFSAFIIFIAHKIFLIQKGG